VLEVCIAGQKSRIFPSAAMKYHLLDKVTISRTHILLSSASAQFVGRLFPGWGHAGQRTAQ